jgi:hypothetical protein
MISRLSAVEEELLNRGRKVLILQNVRDISMRWSQKIQWDAVFRIRDTQDLRLAMTYIQNVSVKPVRVVWIGDEPPMPILSFMQKQEVTFLVGSTSVPRGSWSAIFWHNSADEKEIQDGLQNRPGSQINLSQVLKELRAVSAGLVWSCIGETGSLYWFSRIINNFSTILFGNGLYVLPPIYSFLRVSISHMCNFFEKFHCILSRFCSKNFFTHFNLGFTNFLGGIFLSSFLHLRLRLPR